MSPLPSLLIVDDKRNMVRLMAKVMGDVAQIRTAYCGAEAIEQLEQHPVHAVLCDLKMPDMEGLDVLRVCRRRQPHAAFVLMTAYATVDTAVEALKLGAFDYLTKPFDPDAARGILLKALAQGVAAQISHVDTAHEVLPGVIAQSMVMQQMAEMVRRIADSDVTALILGETGTGKERVARAIHDLSPRAGQRCVALNCAAVPVELLESELFGHVKGAFTGAVADRKGLFEEAHTGSLLLDEIGDMRPSLQAKLTRVLEERKIRRLGEARERPVDVRLIAATHRDLESMVAEGSFRQDLWYRLNVAVIELPPLRDRGDDIVLLAHHFLEIQAGRRRHTLEGFSPAAIEAISQYAWPGNVRQLKAAVERACIVANGPRIDIVDLPPELSRPRPGAPGDPALASYTWAEALDKGRADTGRRYLRALLRRCGGKVSEAASLAGVERESFYRLLRKHGVNPADFR
ncbi:MAG: sigma-54-dependent transcriptional regulator [Bradymonadia bacterium]